MRKLVWLLALMLVACASTQPTGYIRVTGYGSTANDAKLDAFVKATEIHVGTIIVSERESNIKELTKEDILAYSAGFVDDYRVISEQRHGGMIKVVIDVSVSSNKINDRVLAKSSNTQNFNGDKYSNQYQTIIKERNDGDRVLENVLNDYPKRAYTLNIINYSVKVDRYRNLVLSVPYKMHWDKNYLSSLNTTLALLEDSRKNFLDRTPSDIVIRNGNFNFDAKHYYFKDRIRVDNVVSNVHKKPIRLQLLVKNANNELIVSKCYLPQFMSGWGPALYHFTDNGITINNHVVEEGRIDMVIDAQYNQYRSVKDIGSIQLQIVSDNDCKR